MSFGPIAKTFTHPNAVIDTHGPDFCCVKCDRHLETKKKFL